MTFYTQATEYQRIDYDENGKKIQESGIKLSISIYGDFWQELSGIAIICEEKANPQIKINIDYRRNKLHISNAIFRDYIEVNNFIVLIKKRFM